MDHNNDKKKIVLIGAGFVGMSFAFALLDAHICEELGIIDIDQKRAEGEAMDLSHGLAFSGGNMKIYAAKYSDCYDADLAVQPVSAQNGIKYVIAFTCIIFMIFGWIMARRYSLSHEKNAKIEKYLAYQREGNLSEIAPDEAEELAALKQSLR